MTIEVKLLLMEGAFDGQATVFQRLSKKDDFKLISPFINDVRKEFFSPKLPFKWEPKITNFTNREVYEISFILREYDENELKRILQEKKDYLREVIPNFDENLVELKPYEKYEIVEIKKRRHKRFRGPKKPNKNIRYKTETSISRAFKQALEKLKNKNQN